MEVWIFAYKDFLTPQLQSSAHEHEVTSVLMQTAGLCWPDRSITGCNIDACNLDSWVMAILLNSTYLMHQVNVITHPTI